MIKMISKRMNRTNDFFLEDISDSDNEILLSVREYTMTSPERVFATLQAVRYVMDGSLPGDIVECGVWRGGTMMAVAKLMALRQKFSKDLYLFDTFEGMPTPTDLDADFRGRKAIKVFEKKKRTKDSSDWCYAPLVEVQTNLAGVGYPKEKMHFVAGKVEETIPMNAPESIAILRLDTDWYASTKHELVHLYPRLVKGGVLIIDDYGHWDGARRAVDEYFREQQISILLNRIDYTGRIAIKPE